MIRTWKWTAAALLPLALLASLAFTIHGLPAEARSAAASPIIPGTVERPDISIVLLNGDPVSFASLYMYERQDIVYVDVDYLVAKLGGENYGVRNGECRVKIRDLMVVGKIGTGELYLRGKVEGPNHTTVYVCDKIYLRHPVKEYDGKLIFPLDDIAEVLAARVGMVAGLADKGCGRTSPIIIPVPKPKPKPVKKPRKKHGTKKDAFTFKEKYPMYLTVSCPLSPQDVLILDEFKPHDPVVILVPECSALMVLGNEEERQ